MEHFTELKRRTTDLLQSLPETLSPTKASFGNVFSSASAAPDYSLNGTWQRVSVPLLPRSSHSINVVAGTAYLFGGEGIESRVPVDNAMHALVLPTGSASADYYTVQAVPAKTPVENAATSTVSPPLAESDPVVVLEPQTVGTGEAASVKDKEGLPEDTTEEETEEISLESTDKGKGRATDDAVDEISLPGTPLGNVPEPRVGHATAVIGNRIFLFGGRGGPDMKPLEERGRVWVFDTKEHNWSFLDPLSPLVQVPIQAVPDTGSTATVPAASAPATSRPIFPMARSYHAAAAIELPVSETSPASTQRSRKSSWKEWAEGDSAEVGTPQRPIVGNIAARARDADSDGYGTFIIHGGCLAGGGRANDVWAFDVRTRVWQELPTAPGLPRGGTSICLSKNRLYRFGGFNGSSEEGGRLDYLQLGLSSPRDSSVDETDVTVVATGGWQSFVAQNGGPAADRTSQTLEAANLNEVDKSDAAPLAPVPDWPGNRSVSSLEAISAGSGWEYLILALGERSPSGSGHEAAGKFWSDVWAFQVPSDELSAAKVSHAVRNVLPRRLFGGALGAGEGHWSPVTTGPYDEEVPAGVGSDYGPGPRGWIASSPMRELENGILIFGGLDADNKRLGDAWIFRLGAETRE
ncbi:hypothetical protein SEPCBS119000_003800 [Sporothrix epigloea]|uniref:Kelch repeat protein n=1 Tax=Sporothrix epigloea TaxID=1892477 RepID=A0ABP0DNV6_9PEZI